jgi:hypothetical protein
MDHACRNRAAHHAASSASLTPIRRAASCVIRGPLPSFTSRLAVDRLRDLLSAHCCRVKIRLTGCGQARSRLDMLRINLFAASKLAKQVGAAKRGWGSKTSLRLRPTVRHARRRMNSHRQRSLAGRDPNADSPHRLCNAVAIYRGLIRAAKCKNFPHAALDQRPHVVCPQRQRGCDLALV